LILQSCPALQKHKLNQERHADYLAAQASDEINGGGHGAACGQQIVCHQDTVARKHSVLVNLKGVGAVLQGVRGAVRLIRQLPRLSDQGRSGVKLVGQGGSDNESSRLDANHQIDASIGKPFGNLVDSCTKGFAIRQQRRDVFEEDPLLRKVGDVPNLLL